jgi:hypothetical protein
MKDKKGQYSVEYKVRSLAGAQLHGTYVEMIICPASCCSQFIPL